MPDRVCNEVAGVLASIVVAADRHRGLERTKDDQKALEVVIQLGNLVNVEPLTGDRPSTEAELAVILDEVNAAIDFDKDGLFQPAVAKMHMSHPGCRNAVLIARQVIDRARL